MASPVGTTGPTRFSQMSSPVAASSAWMMLPMLLRYRTPSCTTGAGSFQPPSVIDQIHSSVRSSTLSGVIWSSSL